MSKARVTNLKGQPGLTRVNVIIKIVIIIVLKLDSRVKQGKVQVMG